MADGFVKYKKKKKIGWPICLSLPLVCATQAYADCGIINAHGLWVYGLTWNGEAWSSSFLSAADRPCLPCSSGCVQTFLIGVAQVGHWQGRVERRVKKKMSKLSDSQGSDGLIENEAWNILRFLFLVSVHYWVSSLYSQQSDGINEMRWRETRGKHNMTKK